MRIPLNQDLKSRDGTLAKDGLIRNASVTNTQSGVKVDKRAGTVDSGAFVPTGTPSGSFVYNDVMYVWTGAGYTPNQFPVIFSGGYLIFPSYDSSKAYAPDDEVTDLEDSSSVYDPSTNPLITYYATASTTGTAPKKYNTVARIQAGLGTTPKWGFVDRVSIGNSAEALSRMLAYQNATGTMWVTTVGNPSFGYNITCSSSITYPYGSSYSTFATYHELTQTFIYPGSLPYGGAAACQYLTVKSRWAF